MHLLVPIIPLLFLFAFAGPAFAVDGVLEINQACAVQTGCFSGDSAGWPVTIDGTAGRSYRLTGDLVLPNANTNGIYITTHDVRVDLGGFTIIGTACVGATDSSCRPASGTGSGIRVDDILTRYGVSIGNGSIAGTGDYGVRLGPQAEVTGLRLRWNRTLGIYGASGSTISGNTAYQNGDDGIFVLSGSTVSRNTVYENGDDGIYVGDGSTVIGNTAYANDGNGITTSTDCLVQSNTVNGNGGFGLSLNTATAYRENVINDNGNTVNSGFNNGNNTCGVAACP